MPWCPECGTEYREGFTVCADCHVLLADTAPEKRAEAADLAKNRETLLTVVRDEMEFTRVESLMAEAGIPVLKKHRGSGGYLELYMGATPYGLEIYVPYEALPRARALLSGDESLPEEAVKSAEAEASADEEPVILDAEAEKELGRYMDAVNADMQQRKKAIATVMLWSMGAGIIWTVYSILKELL